MTDHLTRESPIFHDIATLFTSVETLFLNLERDHESFRNLWDPDLAAPFYIAEEQKDVFTDWTSLERYFETTAKLLGPVVCRYDLKTVAPLQPDLATAYCQMEWQAAIKPEVEKLGGYVRVVAVLRRSQAGWRFVSYVEAPLAPIVYLGELYRLVARVSPLAQPPAA